MYAAWSTMQPAGVSSETLDWLGASKYGDAGPEWCSGLKSAATATPTYAQQTRNARSIRLQASGPKAKGSHIAAVSRFILCTENQAKVPITCVGACAFGRERMKMG